MISGFKYYLVLYCMIFEFLGIIPYMRTFGQDVVLFLDHELVY